MKCSYCSSEIPKGTGTLYIYRIGNLAYFCSSRCFKNAVVMKRKINPKLVKQRTKASAPQKTAALEKK